MYSAICRCKILAPVEKCGHESCQNQASPLELEFDVAVTLSDTSGSLERCYFMPGILSRHLDCTVRDFQAVVLATGNILFNSGAS